MNNIMLQEVSILYALILPFGLLILMRARCDVGKSFYSEWSKLQKDFDLLEENINFFNRISLMNNLTA